MSHRDPADMVAQPLVSQLNKVRLQILREIGKVLDAVEIIARQTARDLHEEK